MASVACHANKGVCSPSGRGDLWGQELPPRPKACELIHCHISALGWRNERRKKKKKKVLHHNSLNSAIRSFVYDLSMSFEYENTCYRFIHCTLILIWIYSKSEVIDMSRSRAQDEIQGQTRPQTRKIGFVFQKMLQIAP